MADLSVSERRIRPIQDAVASANWKQALQQCEKWQKKGEKSDRFLALSAYILLNQSDKAQSKKGEAETLALCRRNPAITDLDAVQQLQDALNSLSLRHEEGPRLWNRAVAANPTDKDLSMAWLHRSIAEHNWLSAQKATMALRKGYPKERQYEFWNILMCYLVHKDLGISEKERALFGTLAYRMIAKAAEIVPKEKEQVLGPGKAISTPEELNLMIKIYLTTDRASEAVSALQSDTLGADSLIGEQDPQLHLSLLLEALEAAKDWTRAFDVCYDMLSIPSNQTDDRIWILLIESQSKSGNDKLREKCSTLIDSNANKHPTTRSAFLAKINFLRMNMNEDPSTKLLENACCDYIKEYGTKAFCFNDLRPFVDQLGEKALKNMAKTAHELDSGIETQLLRLKFEYYCSDNELHSSLIKFAVEALKVMQSSSTELSNCPEIAVLVAMVLLRVADLSSQPTYYFQVIILLEMVRTKGEDYYPFSILLVQCYLRLGMISLAMEIFAKLSIKNLQWESVGHLLLTRISTLHPRPSLSTSMATNPAGALDAGTSMLDNADQTLGRGIREGLKNGSYVSIVDAVNMESNIEKSMNRQIFTVEQRKIDRILGKTITGTTPDRPEILVDLRDFSFLTNYQDSDLEIQARLRCGPLPKYRWLDAMAFSDQLVTFLEDPSTLQADHDSPAANSVRKTFAKLQTHRGDTEKELTVIETVSLMVYELIFQLTTSLKSLTKSDTDTLRSMIDELQGLLVNIPARNVKRGDIPFDFGSADIIGSISTPDWKYVHTSLVKLECLQSVSVFLGFAIKKTKMKRDQGPNFSLLKERIPVIQDLVVKAEKVIHNDARKLKELMNVSGVLSELVHISFGRQASGYEIPELEQTLEKICSESEVETLCGKMRESWEDALDGILTVRVKLPK